MTLRILLTGKDGQVGHDLARLLPTLGELQATGRADLDLSRPEEIRRLVRDLRPGLIVNAAAYTAVDQAESDTAVAEAVNATAPRVLAEEAHRVGAAIVHYSTDYVFDGTKRVPYAEDDPPNPLNIYGRTKLSGEVGVRESGAPYLLLRTSWVYSTRGKNFLLTVLRLASEREELRIVRDQVGAPTSSEAIAAATVAILRQLIVSGQDWMGAMDRVAGVYHMSAAGETSWCEFARAILEEATRARSGGSWLERTHHPAIVTRRVIPITADDYPTPARRPLYSVLSNEKLARRFGVQLADWRGQLREVLR